MKDFHDFRSMQNRELGDANNFQQGGSPPVFFFFFDQSLGHIEEVVNEDNVGMK